MARLWQSGFGLNSTTNNVEISTWTGTFSIQTSVIRVGPYALRTNPAGATQANARHTIFSSDQSTHVYFRAYLRIASLPSGSVTVMRIVNTANNQCAAIRMTTSGTLQLLQADGTQVGSASSALSTDTWYRIELELDASSSPGSVSGRINGSSWASGANSSQATWAKVLVGPIANITTDLYWADLAVNDTSGSTQTSWPGDGVVLTLSPNAAGDSNQWNNTTNAAGSSNNYQLVDELPPNDATDMVQTGTLNNLDMYNVATSGIGASDTVNVVMVGVRYRNNTADADATARAQIRKTSGGTLAEGSDLLPISTTWRTNSGTDARQYTLIRHTDPDGSAWTQSTVDSMQIGVKLTTAGTNRIQVSSVWAVVDYTPATGTNASAENASGTGAANTPQASIKPPAGNAAGSGAANSPNASVKPSAGHASGSAVAYRAYGPHIYEDWESLAIGAWSEGSTHNIWHTEFVGTDGQVSPVDASGEGRVLELQAHDEAGTSASLVTSTVTTSGDVGYRVRMQTVEQLRAVDPNPWECAWFVWNYTEPDTDERRFYYVALKMNGFELGKVDQSIALPGGQRFLWTDSTPFSVGTWYDVEIQQHGANIRVWVDGTLRANFTDGAGSGGTPAWGDTPGETVMTAGAIGLYHEDARVQFSGIEWDPPTGYGSGTGTAANPSAAIAPSAGHASGTGSAFDATVQTTGNNTDANAEAATGSGTANSPTPSVAPSAGHAAGTGTAADATTKTSPTAQAATGTGDAGTPSASIAVPAGSASGTGQASDATATTAVVGTAQAAAGTGAAYSPTTTVSTAAQPATGSGTAAQASASVAAPAGAASGSGSALDASAAVANIAQAGSASGTGEAHDATTNVSTSASAAAATGSALDASALTGSVALAGVASGTGQASDASPSVAPSAGSGSASGSAHPGTTTGQTTAQPASGTAVAHDAASHVAPHAGEAAGSGQAFNASALTGAVAPAGLASGTGTAHDATTRVAPAAGAASGTGAALDASALTGTVALAGSASATGTAGAPSARVAPAAEHASGSGTAASPTTSVAPTPAAASATGAALDPAGRVAPAAEAATGSGSAVDAAPLVGPTAEAASGTASAGDASSAVAPIAQTASGSGSAPEPSPAVAPSADLAAAAGEALDATATTFTGTQANAGYASGSGEAFDATVEAVDAPDAGTPAGSGWDGLLSILQEARDEAAAEATRQPAACPNDGEPLTTGPHGGLFCRFDGWTPDGSFAGAAATTVMAPVASESLFDDGSDPWF